MISVVHVLFLQFLLFLCELFILSIDSFFSSESKEPGLQA